jgi:hypothetical protein
MTRILIVETASPKRVRVKAEQLLAGAFGPAPQLTILCSDDRQTIRYLQEIAGVELVPLWEHRRQTILADLSRRRFDVLCVFWTGEKRYRRMKRLALRIGAKSISVDSGDGSVFPLTWKAFVCHALFRMRHPLPTDHWDLVHREDSPAPAPYYEGEKVLIVQSAEPGIVLRCLDRLRDRPLFRHPQYTLFCRNRPEILRHFESHPLISRLWAHSETRNAWQHLRTLRREHFAAVVVFFTADPSYRKVKLFAFMLGARHRVVYNENGDCFYFTWRKWFPFLAQRWGERTAHLGYQPRWTVHLLIAACLLIKGLLFPFRFAWLLLVWLKLRSAGLKSSS